MINEQTIILAIIGMVGLFATATVWQRANRINTMPQNNRTLKSWSLNTYIKRTLLLADITSWPI